MNLNINLTPIRFSELKTGDLFSGLSPDTWGSALHNNNIVNHLVNIRTNNTCYSDEYAPNDIVFLLTINQHQKELQQ